MQNTVRAFYQNSKAQGQKPNKNTLSNMLCVRVRSCVSLKIMIKKIIITWLMGYINAETASVR